MSEDSVAGVESAERFEIDIELIDFIDGHQHRLSRDQLQDEMRRSSMEHEGQFHDILVRRSKDHGRFELIDGEGRLEDAKELGQKTIGARIVQADDSEAAILSLQANDLRQGVNPMEYARGLKRAIDKGMPLEECLKRLGRVTPDKKPDTQFGKEVLKLLDLTPEEQEMVARGIINKATALDLARLEEDIRSRVIDAAKEIEGEGGKKKSSKKGKGKDKPAKASTLKLKPSTGETPKEPAAKEATKDEEPKKISQKSIRKAKDKVGLKDGPRFIGMRKTKEFEEKLEETDKLTEDEKKWVTKSIGYLLCRRKTMPF